MRERRIAGAALDVFEEEPLSAGRLCGRCRGPDHSPYRFLTENVWQRHYECLQRI